MFNFCLFIFIFYAVWGSAKAIMFSNKRTRRRVAHSARAVQYRSSYVSQRHNIEKNKYKKPIKINTKRKQQRIASAVYFNSHVPWALSPLYKAAG